MSQDRQPALNLPPIEFDLRHHRPMPQLPRATLPNDANDRYRIHTESVPCERQEVVRNLLNESLGVADRRELDRALSQCRPGQRIDMDFYDDGSTEVGPSGLGKLRLRGRF